MQATQTIRDEGNKDVTQGCLDYSGCSGNQLHDLTRIRWLGLAWLEFVRRVRQQRRLGFQRRLGEQWWMGVARLARL